MSKERLSNIELLRIIAMIGIIFFHYSDHGCHNITPENSTYINYLFQSLFRIGGGVGNCLFILISGFFLVTSKITIIKTVRLWTQVAIYSIASFAIYVLVTGNFTLPLLFYSLTPITHNVYWFFTTYLILYLCSPLLNDGIKSLSKLGFTSLVLLCVTCFSLMPTFGNYNFIDNNRTGVFFTLYFIGAWLRLYGTQYLNKPLIKKIALVTSVSLILLCEWSIVTNGWWHGINSRYRYVWGMEQFLVLATAVSLFILFWLTRIRLDNKINAIAGTVFGIYLIHMNPMTTNFIWNDILKIQQWYYNELMPVYFILSGLALFIICSVIEYIRLRTIEPYITNKLYSSQRLTELQKYFTDHR